jgi:hypothetical protein
MLVCFVFLFASFSGISAFGQTNPRVYLAPSEIATGLAGSDASVELRIDDAQDLVAWEVQITVSPSIVKIKSFTEGEFLKRDGGSTLSVGPNITSDSGKVTYAVACTGKEPGVTGDGILGSLFLTVVKEGVASIDLSFVELLGSQSVQAATTNNSGDVSSHTAAPTYLTSSGGYSSGGSGSSNQPTPETPAQAGEAAGGPQLGEIRGRVVNQAGRVIPNVTARINGVIVQTDSNGVFAFTLVHPGTYEVYYDAPGYVTQTQELQVARAVITGAPTVILKSVAKASSAKIGKKSTLRGKKGRIKRRSIWWRLRRWN